MAVKFKVLAFLVLVSALGHAQKIDRNLLYGNWKIKGVVLRNEVVGFWQPDTLIKKLLQKRKFEQPGKAIPKGDSIAIEMGAHFLCEVLNNLQIQVAKPGQMTFLFAGGKQGSEDTRTHLMQFTFVNDTLLATTDEKGYKSDLKIEKLSPSVLILSGISSARYMQLYFKRE
ncbi:MAG: hypothetical protein V4615_14230 [Bacteroidota bacterium]